MRSFGGCTLASEAAGGAVDALLGLLVEMSIGACSHSSRMFDLRTSMLRSDSDVEVGGGVCSGGDRAISKRPSVCSRYVVWLTCLSYLRRRGVFGTMICKKGSPGPERVAVGHRQPPGRLFRWPASKVSCMPCNPASALPLRNRTSLLLPHTPDPPMHC